MKKELREPRQTQWDGAFFLKIGIGDGTNSFEYLHNLTNL